MDNNRKFRPFGIRDSIAYALGDLGCNMSFALKSTMSIFWTQFMGMDLWYALLLIVVQVWDAINDPLIGSIIDADRRQYKRNKFLAYIWAGSIGLIVGGACCFLPFPNAPTWAKFIIFIAGYVVWDAFYTVANVPYGSLLSLISNDVKDRASLSAWRSVGSIFGNMLPMVILPFIIYDKDDNLIGERVFIAALIMGVLGFICFQLMIRNTEIRVETDVQVGEEAPKFNVVKAFGNFVKNRPAVGATLAAMGMFIGMQGAATAVTVIFQSYYNNVKISGIVQLFAMIPIVVFTPLARKAVARFGKKELATFGSIVSIVAGLGLFVVTPNNTNLDLIIYIVCQLIFSLGLGIYSTVSWAMMGDAIDYNEWKTGKREEGTVYSLHSFFRKLAQGIGPSLVLIIMVAFGYVGADEGNQAWQVAVNMRYIVAATYMFSAILQFVGLGLIYNLDKKTLAQMNKELGRDEETAIAEN
ncbi:MAG: MFS transporter [Clostridia bacterium]|nr:MFS transporter [Clostridia bacterium]MBQ5798298.1 MFS transporter [Clostridia bacterium]